MDRFLLVFLGGGTGALLRYLAGIAVLRYYRGPLPLHTMAINVTGSFLIGLLMTLLTQKWHAHPNWGLLLVTGVLGGYTTFSSFEYETFAAVSGAAYRAAAINVVASVAAGYAAVWLGSVIARP